MRVKSLRYAAIMLLSGAILTFFIGMASVWFLRNLGWITGSLAPILGLDADTAQTLSEIFGQLRSASLNLPLEIVGLICFLFCGLAVLFLAGKHSPKATAEETPKAKKAGRIVTVCVLGVLLFLLLTAVTIWLTEVNDIRFDRVMLRLVSLLKAGIL